MALADDDQQWRWFIDAWLPFDGTVFVSLRSARADIWREPDGDAAHPAGAPALLLRPPLFEPEHIERRIAFGAVQRGAQEGFSLDGAGEFAFESVAQVTAFVRRVYAGGGPGTTGGPAPAPAEGGPGEAADDGWSLAYDVSEDAGGLESRMASACSVRVRRSAANLLIGSMRAALDINDHEYRLAAVVPQLRAAILLTADAYDFWWSDFLAAIRVERKVATDPMRANEFRLIEELASDFLQMPAWFSLNWGNSRHFEWRRLQIPPAWSLALGLPARVSSWLDAVCYIRADRRYLSRQPFSTWGPLLLALTAPWAVSAGACWPAGYLPMHGDLREAWRPLAACSMRMAAEMLPAEALPSSLEDNIERWCSDPPSPAGNPPVGTPTPATPSPDQPAQGPALSA
jgi:hypothetical protein